MRRVLVLGNPGSGKSRFSALLAEKTSLPLIHLDRYFWLPNWQMRQEEEWHNLVDNLLREPAWIMDGAYPSTLAKRLQKADTVFLFELPRPLCIFRILKRVSSSRGQSRPDMADACPERLDLPFLKYAWDFKGKQLQFIKKHLSTFYGAVHIFKRRKDADNYLHSFDG